MNGQVWIITIMWLAIFAMLSFQYMDILTTVSPGKQLAALFVFLIGAPCFLIVNVLEEVLDCILPGGWDDDEGPFKGY
ncbi:MAG: hypothetical protein ACI4TK_18300 [Agathobacter sp.]